MSWGGSVAAMIQSLKANKMLLAHRYNYFDAKKDYLRETKGIKLSGRKATKKEIQQVKEKIRRQKRAERVRVFIVLLIMCPLLIYGVAWTIGSFEDDANRKELYDKEKNVEKYQFYVSDGDNMIAKGKWHNAIFQYSKALEIFPNEYDVQYRLALGYSYKCQHKNKGCERADSLVSRLLTHFPDSEEVKDLRVSLNNKMNE